MKAIVMENKDGNGIVLQEDGTFVGQNVADNEVGTVIQMKSRGKDYKKRIRGFVAAAAVLLISLSAGAYAYATPYYYVSLDVNPSLQMEANIFGRVIQAEAVNDDGKSVLSGIEYKNKNVEQVMTALVEKIGKQGYLDSGENCLMIATVAQNQERAKTLSKKMEKDVAATLNQHQYKNQIYCGYYGTEMVDAAKKWGLTPGKYNIITNLLGYTIETQEQADLYKNTSVRELMQDYTNGIGNGIGNGSQNQKSGTDNDNGSQNQKGDADNGNGTKTQVQSRDQDCDTTQDCDTDQDRIMDQDQLKLRDGTGDGIPDSENSGGNSENGNQNGNSNGDNTDGSKCNP